MLNHNGNNVPLNSSTSTTLSMTAKEPAERIQIDRNEMYGKIHHYKNNHDHRSSGINNTLKKKETLKETNNSEFGNTEPACYYNDNELLKTSIDSSGLYYGTFYENMVGR